MTKDEFLLRFQLQAVKKHQRFLPTATPIKKAAVLVPLFETSEGLQVLLTKRSAQLKHHAGQISFPGGRVDDTDSDLVYTALREANEEIGLAFADAKIIGQFGQYHTLTGYEITPIITFVPAHFNAQANPAEVAEIFSVPLSHFLNIDNHHVVMIARAKKMQPVTFIPYQHYNIWGATAAILRDLALHLRGKV